MIRLFACLLVSWVSVDSWVLHKHRQNLKNHLAFSHCINQMHTCNKFFCSTCLLLNTAVFEKLKFCYCSSDTLFTTFQACYTITQQLISKYLYRRWSKNIISCTDYQSVIYIYILLTFRLKFWQTLLYNDRHRNGFFDLELPSLYKNYFFLSF